MHFTRLISGLTLFVSACLAGAAVTAQPATAADERNPNYQVEPSWPKALPNKWIMGHADGVAVDQQDTIWVLQRPRTVTNDEAWATDAIAFACDDGTVSETGACTGATPIDGLGNRRPDGPVAECCLPAPSVMQFNAEGDLLRAWGGPSDPGFVGKEDGVVDSACDPDAGCQWPVGEHGIYVDHDGFVYIAGNGFGNGLCSGDPCPWAPTHGFDGMVLKFTADGAFVYQVGGPLPSGSQPDSNDTNGAPNGTPRLNRPADMEVDSATNELYIADGYGNHRIVVVDAQTGLYLRHWGAYGQNPVDDSETNSDPGADPNFKNPVHCVRIVDNDVYVCDRVNNRIQVFDKFDAGAVCANSGKQAGLCGFIGEVFLAPDTFGNGSVWDIGTSSDTDQSCLLVVDGTNQKAWVVDRGSFSTLDSFGNGGRNAGQFHWVHNLDVDSRGAVYTSEVDTGKRVQKFVPIGRKDCKL